MSEEIIKKFKSKLKSVENLLWETEKLLRMVGLNPPEKNVVLRKEEKIGFPRGYIRTCEKFKKLYKLDYLIDDKAIIDNIAYALQGSDVFNYFINRFDIALTGGCVFRKMAFINLFSILEGLLYGTALKLHRFCRNGNNICKYNRRCNFYVKSPKMNFENLVSYMINKNILTMTEKELKRLSNLKALRDKVHIWDEQRIEIRGRPMILKEECKKGRRLTYSIKAYNKLIEILQRIRDELPDKVREFEEKRRQSCLKK